MGYQDQLKELGPGAQLANLPIGDMISNLGIGIAKAQEALDENAINTAIKLSEQMLDLPDPKDPTVMRSRSLLSLGFVPTFYQFTEATLELQVDMKWQVEENLGIGGQASANANLGPVAIAASVNADYGRKFGMEASLMTRLKLSMVNVPPPQAFMEYVSNSLSN